MFIYNMYVRMYKVRKAEDRLLFVKTRFLILPSREDFPPSPFLLAPLFALISRQPLPKELHDVEDLAITIQNKNKNRKKR